MLYNSPCVVDWSDNCVTIGTFSNNAGPFQDPVSYFVSFLTPQFLDWSAPQVYIGADINNQYAGPQVPGVVSNQSQWIITPNAIDWSANHVYIGSTIETLETNHYRNCTLASNFVFGATFRPKETVTSNFVFAAVFSGHPNKVSRHLDIAMQLGAAFDVVPVYGSVQCDFKSTANFTVIAPVAGSVESDAQFGFSATAAIPHYASFEADATLTFGAHAVSGTDNAFETDFVFSSSFTPSLAGGGVVGGFQSNWKSQNTFTAIKANVRAFEADFQFGCFVSQVQILDSGVPIPGGNLIPWVDETGLDGDIEPTAPAAPQMFNYAY